MKVILKKGSTLKVLEKLQDGTSFLKSRDPFYISSNDFEVYNYDTVTFIKFEDAINQLIQAGYKLESITLL